MVAGTNGALALAGGVDFPAWCMAGGYGGLVCSLVVAVLLAAFAVRQRRGAPRQLAFAMVFCVLGSILSLVSIWWIQERLNVAGALLQEREVLLALSWIALWGWVLPLATLGAYILFTEERLGVGWSRHLPAVRQGMGGRASNGPMLGEARRKTNSEPSGVWGRLVSLEGTEPAFPLMRQRIVLGREATNDLVLTDERASRYHLEIDWDHGRPCVIDQGSMNGTVLNERPLRGRMLLRDGDVIAVGSQRFRYVALDPSAEASASAAQDEVEATAKLARVATPASVTVPLRQLALVGIAEPVVGMRWALRGPVVTIGRDPGCAICLTDPSVSRLHAQVMIQPDGAFLTDLQSSNGTMRNGAHLTAPQALEPGDALRFGNVELRCERARGDEAEATARPGNRRTRQATTATPALGAPATQRRLPHHD